MRHLQEELQAERRTAATAAAAAAADRVELAVAKELAQSLQAQQCTLQVGGCFVCCVGRLYYGQRPGRRQFGSRLLPANGSPFSASQPIFWIANLELNGVCDDDRRRPSAHTTRTRSARAAKWRRWSSPTAPRPPPSTRRCGSWRRSARTWWVCNARWRRRRCVCSPPSPVTKCGILQPSSRGRWEELGVWLRARQQLRVFAFTGGGGGARGGGGGVGAVPTR